MPSLWCQFLKSKNIAGLQIRKIILMEDRRFAISEGLGHIPNLIMSFPENFECNPLDSASLVLKCIILWGLALGCLLFLSSCNEGNGKTKWLFETTEVSIGSVEKIVRTTGKVIPKNQVVIGAEVSGKVTAVFVDYNSIVSKGDVLAMIDQKDFLNRIHQIKSQIESSKAENEVQEAGIDRAKAALENANLQYNRQIELHNREAVSLKQLELAKRDVDIARANFKLSNAQLKSGQARIRQLESSLDAAQTELERTTIRSPIDGIIIDRKVDPGQAVQSSFSTPELFTIAADLSEIDIFAEIVESDVAELNKGDPVLFRVDAYPNLQVEGHVEQLRVRGRERNGIVSYVAIISAKNPQQLLMPGMTASIRITSEVRPDVLRIQSDAERFRPLKEHLIELEKIEKVTLESYKVRDGLAQYFDRLRTLGLPEKRIDDFRAIANQKTENIRRILLDPAQSSQHSRAERSLSKIMTEEIQKFLSKFEYAAYEAELALERNRRTVDLWIPKGDYRIVRRTVTIGLIDDSYAEIVSGLGMGEKVITKITKIEAN